MIVRCIANTGKDLPDHYLDKQWRTITYDTLFKEITVGKEYVVYAIDIETNGQIRYAIADDIYRYYPMRYAAPLFEVIDNRISKYWRYAFYSDQPICGIWAFEEWVSEPQFHWNLVEGERREKDIFRQMKKMMDEEAQGI